MKTIHAMYWSATNTTKTIVCAIAAAMAGTTDMVSGVIKLAGRL